MNLDKKIDYSIALLRKAESMALRLDPEWILFGFLRWKG